MNRPEFPYPSGPWFVRDLTPDRRFVGGDERIIAWIESKGFDPNETYGVSAVGWSVTSRPWFAFVHRFAVNEDGKKYVSKWRRWTAARRFPRLVRL